MKKSLTLKLVVLAIISYVAITAPTSDACEQSMCITVQSGGTWENACAYFGGYNYPAKCIMESRQTGPDTWENYCTVQQC